MLLDVLLLSENKFDPLLKSAFSYVNIITLVLDSKLLIKVCISCFDVKSYPPPTTSKAYNVLEVMHIINDLCISSQLQAL